jgi:histidyl-tRNA synthetase
MPVSRKKYRTELQNYFSDHRAILDEDSLHRLEKNPMRILDSKNPDLQSIIEAAPKMLDFLDNESSEHFEILKDALTSNGIPFILNDKLVRGLDYYTKTVFEWTTDQLGSQATVCGGGRYDGLVKELGGQDIPAIGCAIGVERLTELVAVSNENPQNKQPKIYIVAVGKEAQNQALVLSEKIRDLGNGISVVMNMDGGSFKQQFKRADKSGSDLALIIGEEEIESGTVSIKSMKSDAEQKSVDEARVLEEIKQYL